MATIDIGNAASLGASDILKVGDELNLTTHIYQDVTGAAKTVRCQIIEQQEKNGKFFSKVRVLDDLGYVQQYRLIAPNTLDGMDYAAASAYNKETYCAMCDQSTGQFSNGDAGHRMM
jgi:hypothetical protein